MSKERLSDKEKEARLFLRQRFGVEDNNNQDGLSFHTAIEALRHSHQIFIKEIENRDKLFQYINSVLNQAQPIFSDNSLRIQYRIHVEALVKTIDLELGSIMDKHYRENITEKLKNKQFILIPIVTESLLSSNQNGSSLDKNKGVKDSNSSCHNGHFLCRVKALAMFPGKLLKINRITNKTPNITIYKIQKFDEKNLEDVQRISALFQKLLQSTEHPIEHKNWDKEVNEALNLEKINKIIKKEHLIDDCAWSTAKLTLYSIIYAIILESLKALEAKDIFANKIAISIAEYWYKLFTIDDRNRAIYSYLSMHGNYAPQSTHIQKRIATLKDFLNAKSKSRLKSDIDYPLLIIIYNKSLNWLLADYLDKGEVEAARALLKNEVDNKNFKPLFYAVRNGKLTIADLLSRESTFVNDLDEEGNTAFMIACCRGQLEICKVLVKYQKRNNLNLRAVNKKGMTCLHLAALNNQRAIVEYLLEIESGLLDIQNNNGETALNLAIANEFEGIAKLLRPKT